MGGEAMAETNVRDNAQPNRREFTLGSMAFVGLLRLLPYLLRIPYPWNCTSRSICVYGGPVLVFGPR